MLLRSCRQLTVCEFFFLGTSNYGVVAANDLSIEEPSLWLCSVLSSFHQVLKENMGRIRHLMSANCYSAGCLIRINSHYILSLSPGRIRLYIEDFSEMFLWNKAGHRSRPSSGLLLPRRLLSFCLLSVVVLQLLVLSRVRLFVSPPFFSLFSRCWPTLPATASVGRKRRYRIRVS